MNQDNEMKTYPEWLTTLQASVANNLPDEQAKAWTARLSNAVRASTDLVDCKHRFLARLLRECLVFDRKKFPGCAEVIDKIAALHDRWKETDNDTWAESESDASSAAWSAMSAADSASSASSAAWVKIADILIEEVER
jgi:hypothetical protein